MQSFNEGILSLRPLAGTDLGGVSARSGFSRVPPSPYLTIGYKNNKYKTKVHDGGGKEPQWKDEFTLEIDSAADELVLRCWDQDLTSSDAVGFIKLKMSSLIINCGVEDWFTIMYENKPAGDIKLKTHFEPKGGNQYE